MIDEAKQYLKDKEIIFEFENQEFIAHQKLTYSHQIVQLLADFTLIQLQKQHDKTLEILRHGSD